MAEIDDINCESFSITSTGKNCADRTNFAKNESRNVENWTCLKALLIDLQKQIDLLGNGNGTGSTISDLCGPIGTVSADTSAFSACDVDVQVNLSFEAQNADDDNGGAIATRAGDVVVYCENGGLNTEIARGSYSFNSGQLANGQIYGPVTDQLIFNNLSCAGVITVVFENTSGVTPTPGTAFLTHEACINASCTNL